MNKSSQNVQNLVFLGKIYGFFGKNWLFQKPPKINITVVGWNWISKISQNVENVASSWKEKIGFSKKIFEFFSKPLKAANLMQNATDFVGFLKTFKNWFSFEKK